VPTLATNDIETYYERAGSGPPVVFVHGGWLDRRTWTPQVEAFADEYEVITEKKRARQN
jgi:pimeloyl-ACP methyl ester carboxylesterase